MKFILLIFLFTSTFLGCSGQPTSDDQFNEAKFKELSRGSDGLYPYVITYVNTEDSSYKLKKIFQDSLYRILMSKHFLVFNIPNGPFAVFGQDKIIRSGQYKNGQWDGEILNFQNGKLFRKTHFEQGVKVGVWEDFDSKGKLIEQRFYEKGKLVNTKKF